MDEHHQQGSSCYNCQHDINWSALTGILYGRDDLLVQLSCAYERCLQPSAGESEIILLSGPSGVGKTALASSLKDRVVSEHGYFLAGKFDQVAATNHLTAKSYGPFVEAITEYTKQVMKSDNNIIHCLREALLEGMCRSELLVLLETIPALNKILRFRHDEHQTGRMVLRGVDAEERFIYIFCNLIQIISSQGYPIVLLLDDIQWLNSSSLSLLKAIACIEKDKIGSQLFVLCTCRTDDRASFDQMYCDLQHEEYKVTTIKVSNLTLDAVHKVVSDGLLLDQDMATPIAEIIFERTQGNPFHLLQLLKVVEKEGLPLAWGKHANNPTAVELLNKRIEKLPENVKHVLKVAACLGCIFSEECLVAGVFLPESDILWAIRLCEKEGIIVCVKAHTFRFTHDKFQKSFYMLIPNDSKDEFHLDVGLRLWHWVSLEARDEHLLLMGDQISRAIHLVKDKEERDDLANLFLQAGMKAARVSSFSAAAAYLKCGIDLLNRKHWKKQYKLSLALYNSAVEIEYYCGDFVRVDALVAEVLVGAQSFDDTLVARFTRIYSLGSRCEMAQALDEGFKVLKQLDEPLPRQVGYLRMTQELLHCKLLLRRRSERSLFEARAFSDTKKLTAMRLMIILYTFAFNGGDNYGPILAARAARMSLEHGLNELSSAGFAILVFTFATRGDVEDAYRCSQLALSVFARYQSTEWQPRVSVAVYAFAFPLKHPLRDSVDPLLEGHRSGLVLGDIHFSMLCAYYHCLIRLYAGDPLPQLMDSLTTYCKLCEQYGQRFVVPHLAVLMQLVSNLMGESLDPLVLSGRCMKEEDATCNWKVKNPISFLLFLNCKHFVAVYMNDHALAGALTQSIKLAKARLLPLAGITHSFLQAVSSVTTSQRQLYLNKVKQSARHCPDNFLHKVYLVEAELANSAGCHDEALAKFDMAIAQAERHGFIHEQALACERAAYAMRGRGKHKEASDYFVRASSLYGQWGARVKVDQLAKEIKHTISSIPCATFSLKKASTKQRDDHTSAPSNWQVEEG